MTDDLSSTDHCLCPCQLFYGSRKHRTASDWPLEVSLRDRGLIIHSPDCCSLHNDIQSPVHSYPYIRPVFPLRFSTYTYMLPKSHSSNSSFTTSSSSASISSAFSAFSF